MAVNKPDIYQHNNPDLAFVDSDYTKGGFRTGVVNLTALYALSGKTGTEYAPGQLKNRSTIVYVSGETKYYILKDINNVGNSNGWEIFVSGGGNGTLSGVTNGLNLVKGGTTVSLGGALTGDTTIGDGNYQLILNVTKISDSNSYVDTIVNCGVAFASSTVYADNSVGLSSSDVYGISSVALAQGISCGNYSVSMSGGQTETGATYSVAMAGGIACNNCSVATNNGIACGDNSVAMAGGCTFCNYSVAMVYGQARGYYSVAMADGITCCNNSVAMILGTACGECSLAVGRNNIIKSFDSAIIGGYLNTLSSGNTCSVMLGGTNLIVPANCYPSSVIVPNLVMLCTPSNGVATDCILAWNSTDKKVKVVAGGTLGDKNNIYSISAVTTNAILNSGSSYVLLVNSPTTPITITLPATPKTGEAFKIKDASGQALTYNITISGNGKNIDGFSTALINTDYGAVELVYNLDLNAWYTLSYIN